MKKILLLAGISAIGASSFAAGVAEPLRFDDTFFQSVSPNGKYAVSCLSDSRVDIFNMETGEHFTYSYTEETPAAYYIGIGQCLSNNGILVGGTSSEIAEYWKDGEWHLLDVPGAASYINSANAITPDGSRICGMLGIGGDAYYSDVLMAVPCIWNAEEDGYSMAVELPHPEVDFAGRVPQYIKAIDISGDGKTVVGMVTDATGRFSYPILYKENEEGNWSYEIPNEDLLVPDGLTFPENPGDFTDNYPMPESYMTPDELAAYREAYNAYAESGYTTEEPQATDYMSAKAIESYEKALEDYWTAYQEYSEKFDAYMMAYDKISEYAPSYQDNSVRISNDGLTFGCTIQKGGGPWSMTPMTYHVWIFDINSKNIIKYDSRDDLCLSYLADGGVGVSSTPISSFFNIVPSQSFILKDGEVLGMYDWMNSKVPENASWMKQNMVFSYESYDPETGDAVIAEELMTGHATSTPDLSIMALSVQNIGFPVDEDAYEDPDFSPAIGFGYIFDLKEGTGVDTVGNVSDEKTIYDLSGRKLKNANAPGIYIINGEKKVIR